MHGSTIKIIPLIFCLKFHECTVYVNTTPFTLLHSYMFRSSRGHLQGILIHFVSRETECVSSCEYMIKEQFGMGNVT
jgi:hypothetical protein